jgi:hypothetical protein
MSIPDFDRAEYIEPQSLKPQTIEGEIVGRPLARTSAFPMALLFGTIAAVVGCIGYSLVASLGFMLSIVAIGVAWLIAKAMMTASRGIGGRSYQIAAVILTYIAVSVGELLPELYKAQPAHVSPLGLAYVLCRYGLIMPFLELQAGFNSILGVIILLIGLRTAWRLAAGSPGFGSSNGPAMTPFGPR